jgi:histidinol-phosphate/aromatic aminotransferase/cobyric acid decarboxylase-like protein
LQHNNGSMQQLAAALGKVGSPYRHQHGAAAAAPADADAEAKVEKMRDMLRAALMELSAVRGKAQAAGGRYSGAPLALCDIVRPHVSVQQTAQCLAG